MTENELKENDVVYGIIDGKPMIATGTCDDDGAHIFAAVIDGEVYEVIAYEWSTVNLNG